MDTPFFNTQNFRPLRLACNLVTFAHQFFTRPVNREFAARLTNHDDGVMALVSALQVAQEALAPHLPLTGVAEIWQARESYLGRIGIQTTFAQHGTGSPSQEIGHALDLQMLEAVLSEFPMAPGGPLPAPEVIHLACKCFWLSEVVALAVIGIATVQRNPDGNWVVQPASDAQRAHLRRLWFASAFETASLAAATAAIVTLAAIAFDPSMRDLQREAEMTALTIFPQHWRLPPDSGPLPQLLFGLLDSVDSPSLPDSPDVPVPRGSLEALLIMMVHGVIASEVESVPAFGPQHAEANGITDVYQFVRGVQETLPVVDRLFNVVPNGLVLGTRQLAPAAIEMAEKLADRELGPNWHGDVTSDAQKAYLLGRLSKCEHVEILDFELLKHHTAHDVDLDVDFFLRDTAHNQIYGVQLKHLQRKTRAGLVAWLGLFRERNADLGNLVRQLENLSELGRTDDKCRAFLTSHGLSLAECDRIIPVGLHNVGFVDFCEVQNGVLLYDMHTFVNVMKAEGGVAVGMANGRVVHDEVRLVAGSRPSLHEPDAVIASRLRDPSMQHLEAFDVIGQVCRKGSVGGATIATYGLGI